jgi:hypothetical protein
MDSTDLKEVIIALINQGLFYAGGDNEETAKEIAKFEKAYYGEASK